MSTRRGPWVAAVFVVCLTGAAGPRQTPTIDDEELARHLATLQAGIENPGLEIDRRQELVFEAANMLDRAALGESTPAARQRRWDQAVEVIDRFLKNEPNPPRERVLRMRTGVFRWAIARSWREAWRLDPRDDDAKKHALDALDDSIARLRNITGQANDPVIADEYRYRLAQSLADRAGFEPAGAKDRVARETEALALLEPVSTLPELLGYWHLLTAKLFQRAGKTAEAERALNLSARSTPAPPERELVEARSALDSDLGRYDEAAAMIAASRLEPRAKALYTLRVRLAQHASPGEQPDRKAADQDLWRSVKALRDHADSPEGRLGLLALAQSGIEPDPEGSDEAWEATSLAQAIVGHADKAGRALEQAAVRAIAVQAPTRAAEYRLKAGAYFYRAGRFAEAEQVLDRVVADPTAGAVRARAGMLRVLALGRSVALARPGARVARYEEALDRQIKDFPTDPSTDQARLLLAARSVEAGEMKKGRDLYQAVSKGSPHWLETRLALADLDRAELLKLSINPDAAQQKAVYQRSNAFLSASLAQAPDSAAPAIELAWARLALEPEVGDPARARDLCDRILARGGDARARYRARLYRVVALVELGRYVEAEQAALDHANWRSRDAVDVLVDVARLLDRDATDASIDLRTRRFGLVLRLLLEPVVTAEDDQLPREARAELALRLTRAFMHTGDDVGAKRSMNHWRGLFGITSEPLLRDLGETYARLGVSSLAIDVERLRIKNNPSGSLPWLDARYALALAYFRTGKAKDAAQLIEATAILHPDLGGGQLREKFLRLRQRIGTTP